MSDLAPPGQPCALDTEAWQNALDRFTPPRWQLITGIDPQSERQFTSKQRRVAIRRLAQIVEKEIRLEFQAAREESQFKEERTFLWDPIPAVCKTLEIGQSALSRMLKELTGMSAVQFADRIRIEGAKEKLRDKLVAFIRDNFKEPGDRLFGLYNSPDKERAAFWEKLRKHRRDPSFSLSTWAVELGFPSYARFAKACQLAYGKVPRQLEDEIFRDAADYVVAVNALCLRKDRIDCPATHKNAHVPEEDAWAEVQRTRPDWLKEKIATLGLYNKIKVWIERPSKPKGQKPPDSKPESGSQSALSEINALLAELENELGAQSRARQ